MSLFFLTLSALPFGIDSVFWSHFSQTTVESTPPGLSDVYVHPIGEDIRVDKEVELAHSLIYDDIQVIRRIERWMFDS